MSQFSQSRSDKPGRSVDAASNATGSETESLSSKCVVPMKAGESMPPFFVTHGVGGDVNELLGLVGAMKIRNPVCGLQAGGFADDSEPLLTVEELAEYFLKAVREIQPHGPYFLFGYSFGGSVVLEMARTLTSEGETVGLAAMAASYLHRSQLRGGARRRAYLKLGMRHFSTMRRLPISEWFGYLTDATQRQRLSMPNEHRSPEVPNDPVAALRMERYRSAQHAAWAGYVPRKYSGEVHYFEPSRSHPWFPEAATQEWSRYLTNLKLHSIPGNHFDMIETHVDVLASQLSNLLNERSAAK